MSDEESWVAALTAVAPPGTRITIIHTPSATSGGMALLSTSDAVSSEASTAHAATSIEVASRHRDADGEAMKAADWAVVLPGISARELDRAIDEGVLPARRKGEGRDHNAKIISGEDVVRYLTLCQDIQWGHTAVPTWWNLVQRGSRANVVISKQAA